jgi:hypothetical protein
MKIWLLGRYVSRTYIQDHSIVISECCISGRDGECICHGGCIGFASADTAGPGPGTAYTSGIHAASGPVDGDIHSIACEEGIIAAGCGSQNVRVVIDRVIVRIIDRALQKACVLCGIRKYAIAVIIICAIGACPATETS